MRTQKIEMWKAAWDGEFAIAARLLDDSMSPKYPPGDVLLFTKTGIEGGDGVLIFRQDHPPVIAKLEYSMEPDAAHWRFVNPDWEDQTYTAEEIHDGLDDVFRFWRLRAHIPVGGRRQHVAQTVTEEVIEVSRS